MLKKYWSYLIILVLIFVPLYPKFPLFAVGGSFVAVRLEDFVIAAVVGIWFLVSWKNRFSDLKNPVSAAILLYLAAGVVSWFSGGFLTHTIDFKLGFLHLLRRVEYMSLFWVGFGLLKDRLNLRFVINCILLVSLLVSLYGLGQQYLNFPVISTNNSEFSKGLVLTLGPGARLNSTFAGHYDLAAFSILPILLVIGLLAQPARHKWLLAAIGSLAYGVMLLSASRVTFAAVIVTAGLFILVLRKYKWLAILVVVTIVSVLASGQLMSRYLEFITSHAYAAVDTEVPDALKPAANPNEDRSLNIRLNAEWPQAWRAFVKNPVLGTGFSSVGLAVDNDYLRVLAETGALGLAAFSLILWRIGKTCLPFIKSRPASVEQIFVVTVGFFLLGILLNAIFIDVFEASKVAILTWLLLGVGEYVKKSA